MDSLVSNIYNFMTSTVVPVAIEQTSNLMSGTASALTTIGQAALEWGSGSEDATASSEVFSWESRGSSTVAQTSSGSSGASESAPAAEMAPEQLKSMKIKDIDRQLDEGNTSWEWVKETPEETGPVKHNQFEMVQNDYEWMKNSK